MTGHVVGRKVQRARAQDRVFRLVGSLKGTALMGAGVAKSHDVLVRPDAAAGFPVQLDQETVGVLTFIRIVEVEGVMGVQFAQLPNQLTGIGSNRRRNFLGFG